MNIAFLSILLNLILLTVSSSPVANIFLFHFGSEVSEWINIWLYFVKYQQNIQYTVLTDKAVADFKYETLSQNIKIISTSIKEITERARLVLNMTESLLIPNPYKLCDYRILFGLIFKHELDIGCGNQPCEYWGWSDFDNIAGNVFDNSFFPQLSSTNQAVDVTSKEWLAYKKYDIIATNYGIPTNGPFSLLKNNYVTTHLYKLVANYISSLQSNKPAYADEVGLKHAILFQEKLRRLTIYTPPQDMTCKNHWLWYNGTLYDLRRVARIRCAYFHYGGGSGTFVIIIVVYHVCGDCVCVYL